MKLFTKRAAKKKRIDAIARGGGAARADPTLTVVATIPICESREESDRMVEVLSPAADALEARTREGATRGPKNSKKAASKKRRGAKTTSRRKKVWEIEAEREAAEREAQAVRRKSQAHKTAARKRPSSSSRGRYQRGPSPGLSLDSLPEDAVLDERPAPGLSSKARAELDMALDADAVARGPTSPAVIREYAPTLSPLSNRSGATMRVDNRRKAKTPTAQRSMRSFRSLFAPALVQESFSEDEEDDEEEDDETEAEEEGNNMLPELDSLFRAAKRAKDSLVGGAPGRGSEPRFNFNRVKGDIDVVADDDESLEVPIGGNGWASILGCTALRCTDGAEARANDNDDFVVGEGEGEEVDIHGGDEATLATYDTRTVDEQTVDTNTVDTPLAEEIRAAIPSLTHLFGAQHPAEDETLGTVQSLETYDSRAATADGSGTLATGLTGTTGSRTTAATSTSETTYESTLEGSSYETEDTDGSDVTEGDIKRSWMRALGFRFGARKKELAIAAASPNASERPDTPMEERRERARTTALALGASASSDGTGSKAGRSKAGSVVQRLRKSTASSSLAGMIDKFVADRQQARGASGSPDTILTEKPSVAEEAKATEETPKEETTTTPEPAAKEEAVTTTTEQEATEPEATKPEATKPEATEATKPEASEQKATEQKATEKEATEKGLESEAKIAETPNAMEPTSEPEPEPEPESRALANETTPIASAPEPAPKVEAIVETPVAAETPAPANQDVRQAPTPTIGMYAAADVAYGSRSASKSVAPLKPPKEARSLSSRSRARSLRSMHRRRHSAHAPAIFDKMLAIGAAKKEGAALPRGRAQSEEVSADPTKWIAETIDDRNAGVEVLASARMMVEGRDDRDEEPVAFPSVAADEERDDAPRDDGEGSVTDLRSVGTDSLMLQAEVLLGQ